MLIDCVTINQTADRGGGGGGGVKKINEHCKKKKAMYISITVIVNTVSSEMFVRT